MENDLHQKGVKLRDKNGSLVTHFFLGNVDVRPGLVKLANKNEISSRRHQLKGFQFVQIQTFRVNEQFFVQ